MPDPPPVAFQVVTEITIISHLAQTLTERALPQGLSWAQFGVLNHLTRLEGDWSPARLAAAFQVTKGGMTFTLQRLEAQGFVAFEPHPDDGRSKRVVLTGPGRKAYRGAVGALGPQLQALAQDFAPGEFDTVLPILARLRAWFDARR